MTAATRTDLRMKGFFHLKSSRQFTELFAGFAARATETVALADGLGRFLADEIVAPEALPPFARSTMDGFAVRARDTFGCSESEPALLTVTGEVAMGASGSAIRLASGETARIWTGGELAAEADAVVMLEYSHAIDERTIEIFRAVAPGENVIRAGDDFRQGVAVLSRGHRLRPQDLGVLAGLGIIEIKVTKRPLVAIISTGDELVPPEQTPGPGRIRDINTTTLAGLVREAGAIPLPLGIIPDTFSELLAACRAALDQGADMLLVSGGSSVGKRDFTLAVFEALDGTEVLAHGVAIRPSRPKRAASRPSSPGSIMPPSSACPATRPRPWSFFISLSGRCCCGWAGRRRPACAASRPSPLNRSLRPSAARSMCGCGCTTIRRAACRLPCRSMANRGYSNRWWRRTAC